MGRLLAAGIEARSVRAGEGGGVKLQAILHGIRVGWLHFRYPPISNDPVFVPSDWALKYMTDDYLLTRDLGTLMPVDGPWVAYTC